MVWASWAVGVVLLLVAASVLWSVDDSCPQWEDEGSMAAPASPYSVLICGPQDPPYTWAVLAAALTGGALAWWVARRRRGTGSCGRDRELR